MAVLCVHVPLVLTQTATIKTNVTIGLRSQLQCDGLLDPTRGLVVSIVDALTLTQVNAAAELPLTPVAVVTTMQSLSTVTDPMVGST
jgi:hypothetical protein